MGRTQPLTVKRIERGRNLGTLHVATQQTLPFSYQVLDDFSVTVRYPYEELREKQTTPSANDLFGPV